jgi:hypothetical protein
MNHSLCILHQDRSDKGYYHALYNIVIEYLGKGYQVIYAAENNSPSKTLRNFAKVKTTTIASKTDIEIEDYVDKGQLTVIDYDSLSYQSNKNKRGEEIQSDNNDNNRNDTTILTFDNLIKGFQSEINRKRRKQNSSNYYKILIMGSCRPFSERHDYDGLMAYEKAINNEILSTDSSSPSSTSTAASYDIECICCYRISVIKQISSLSLIIAILLNHNIIISVDYNNSIQPLSYKNINNNYEKIKIITKSIKSGIDKMLGNNTSDLILKTLKLVYHIDEEDIIRQPDLFADKLVKVVGKSAADPILSSILDEIKQYLVYADNNAQLPNY